MLPLKRRALLRFEERVSSKFVTFFKDLGIYGENLGFLGRSYDLKAYMRGMGFEVLVGFGWVFSNWGGRIYLISWQKMPNFRNLDNSFAVVKKLLLVCFGDEIDAEC